jgi:hypothetical protein
VGVGGGQVWERKICCGTGIICPVGRIYHAGDIFSPVKNEQSVKCSKNDNENYGAEKLGKHLYLGVTLENGSGKTPNKFFDIRETIQSEKWLQFLVFCDIILSPTYTNF